MPPEVVHHVTLGSEALTAVLRAVKRPVVIVHPHVDRKIVSIVEVLLAFGHRANKLCSRLVVCQMSLQILTRLEFLRTVTKGALEDLCLPQTRAKRDSLRNLAILAPEALGRGALGLVIVAQSESVFVLGCNHGRLRLSVGGL